MRLAYEPRNKQTVFVMDLFYIDGGIFNLDGSNS